MKATTTQNLSKGIVVLVALLLIATLFSIPVGASSPAGEYIVREAPGAGDVPEDMVETLGGDVLEQIAILGGFIADLPADAAAALADSELIIAVTPNAPLQLSGAGWENASTLGDLDPKDFAGSLHLTTKTNGAQAMWAQGFTGAGIDIALIDSGIVPSAASTVTER